MTYPPVIAHRQTSAREVLEGGLEDIPAHNQEILRFLTWASLFRVRGPVNAEIARAGCLACWLKRPCLGL